MSVVTGVDEDAVASGRSQEWGIEYLYPLPLKGFSSVQDDFYICVGTGRHLSLNEERGNFVPWEGLTKFMFKDGQHQERSRSSAPKTCYRGAPGVH